MLPIFNKRIQEIAIRLPGIETELTYKLICTRDLKDFHFDETTIDGTTTLKKSTKQFRREETKIANRVKSEIIATLMCLVVQEKIGKKKESFQNFFQIKTPITRDGSVAGKRDSPLRTPIFLKMVKSTGLLIFLVLSDPLNPILKKLGCYLESRRGNWI